MPGIDITQIYSSRAGQQTTQAPSQGASADRTTAPNTQPQAAPVNHNAVRISFLGILIALVALRLIYEFSS